MAVLRQQYSIDIPVSEERPFGSCRVRDVTGFFYTWQGPRDTLYFEMEQWDCPSTKNE